MTEWKQIPGFEGYYEASSDGRIRSMPRTNRGCSKHGTESVRRIKGKEIRQHTRMDGKYYHVTLAKEGVNKTRTVHSLVLEAFVGLRKEGYEALHIDGNSHNNALTNLRWGSHAENEADKLKHGGVMVGEQVHTAKLKAVQVAAIKAHTFKYGDGARIARLLGLTKETVNKIKAGKIWKSVDPKMYASSREFAEIATQLQAS